MKFDFSLRRPILIAAISISASGGLTRATSASQAPVPPILTPPQIYQFGPVSPLKTADAEHVFEVANNTSLTQVITSLQPSCGCTLALVSGSERLPLTLLPGHSCEVKVTVNLEYLPPGAIDKYVDVMVQGQQSPAAVLEMEGSILAPVMVSPEIVDFGEVAAGSEKSIILTVGMNPALLELVNPPKMVAGDTGDVIVQATPGGETLRGASVARSYRVTLSPNAPAGLLNESLTFRIPAPTMIHSVRAIGGKAGSPEIDVSVPVRADIVGSITSSPKEVLLSTVADNEGPPKTSAEITLTGNHASDLDGLTVESNEPAVTAAFEDSDASGQNQRKIVVTALSAGGTGVTSSKIVVTDNRGRMFVVPVHVIR
jgi:hypothetical protein